MNQHLSLAVGMVVGLVLVWEKLYTPTSFFDLFAIAVLLVVEHALVL